MENRENFENIEDRESRDVIGRKKGPVLASVILAAFLIVFTRGKGLNFGRDAGRASGSMITSFSRGISSGSRSWASAW